MGAGAAHRAPLKAPACALFQSQQAGAAFSCISARLAETRGDGGLQRLTTSLFSKFLGVR